MIELAVILVGLALGSFLNVCIYRLPRNLSIVKPRSRCPKCNHQLSISENIPVISYLMLHGKCKSCQTSISVRYPIVEILASFATLVSYKTFGLTLTFPIVSGILFMTIIITFIDLDFQVIPNELLLFGFVLAMYPLLRYGWISIKPHLIGAISLGLGFFLIASIGQLVFKQESMGGGDVKYAALIGLILGWGNGLVAVALAFLSAAVLILFLIPLGKTGIGQRIPFGPFLSIGLFVSLLWGNNIIKGYLSFVR